MINNTLLKIVAFVAFFAYILAVIGGIGYLVSIHQYVIAFAVLILGLMAYPTLRQAIHILTN